MERILKLLENDCRLTNKEIATMLSLTENEVARAREEYEKNGVERKFPYCDYELVPKSAWNYGFDDASFEVEERPVSSVPFASDKPAVVLHTRMAPVEWAWADGYDTVPEVKPVSNKAIGPAEEKELIPYGCAKLRMTEMPLIRK